MKGTVGLDMEETVGLDMEETVGLDMEETVGLDMKETVGLDMKKHVWCSMGSGGGGDQHFCLRWDNFHSNIATSFEQLRDHEDFVDVTLACEGRTIKAHKVVLSACSPYFRSLLKQNPCQHPIIILRDVAFADVSALLSFVYQGEVYVSQDRLTAFLRTAELLHIKGLTEQQQHHHPATTGPATSSSSGGHETGSSSCFGSNIAVSLLAPQSSGGASAPLNHLVATAPHPPHSPIEQGSHPAARGVPRSPSPTRPPSSPSPPPPPPLPYIPPPPSHHISPPPKKRRHQSLLVPPPGSPRCCSVEPPPLSSCPSSSQPPDAGPPLPQLTTAKLECGVSSIMAGSTLAAALTAPRDMPVVKEPLSSPLLLPPLVEVKQEVMDSPYEDTNSNSSAASEQQAVNLSVESTGGSILRQRIQGYQGSPDAPPPPSFSQRSSGTGDEDGGPEMVDKKDEGITPPTAAAIIRRQHMLGLAAAAAAAGVYTRSGGTTTTTSSGGSSDQGAHAPPVVSVSNEKQILDLSDPRLRDCVHAAAMSPLCWVWVLRGRPSHGCHIFFHLEGLANAPCPANSGSGVVTTAGRHRWRCMQPRLCPFCWKTFSNSFNLKQHVVNVHTVGQGLQCHLCHKTVKNKWYLRKHHVTAHGAPLKRGKHASGPSSYGGALTQGVTDGLQQQHRQADYDRHDSSRLDSAYSQQESASATGEVERHAPETGERITYMEDSIEYSDRPVSGSSEYGESYSAEYCGENPERYVQASCNVYSASPSNQGMCTTEESARGCQQDVQRSFHTDENVAGGRYSYEHPDPQRQPRNNQMFVNDEHKREYGGNMSSCVFTTDSSGYANDCSRGYLDRSAGPSNAFSPHAASPPASPVRSASVGSHDKDASSPPVRHHQLV
ncbi:BTB/POZ domain [Trinorchestia longiramus]|nr:BTB/POZ domain [Trinorchestia longiramus]